MAKAFPSLPHPIIIPHDEAARMGQKFTAGISEIHGADNMHLLGTKTVEWTPKRGLKEGCPMSPILVMADYNVYIKELRHRHPTILFLSYVDDILFVARNMNRR